MPETQVATDESVADPEAPAQTAVSSSVEDAALQEADLLIEDVSIDGMCGVY
jgi:mycofactocin precursor